MNKLHLALLVLCEIEYNSDVHEWIRSLSIKELKIYQHKCTHWANIFNTQYLLQLKNQNNDSV